MASLEDIRRRHPHLTEEQANRVVKYLETAPAPVTRIWAGEDQMADTPADVDAHGLTRAMRELNAYADENALPLPFPPRS